MRSKYLRTVVAMAVFAALIFGLIESFKIYGETARFKEELNDLKNKNLKLEEENRKLSADIEYFQNPNNLEKELRSRFNYKFPGEKIIIIPEMSQ